MLCNLFFGNKKQGDLLYGLGYIYHYAHPFTFAGRSYYNRTLLRAQAQNRENADNSFGHTFVCRNCGHYL